MHRIALHRLEWAWSLSEGTIYEKACQFLGCKSKTTEPTHGAPKAICLGVLSVPNPKPGGSLAAEQSHSSSRSSAPLCPGPCFSLPADATWERTWAEGYLVAHDWFIRLQARPARPLLPTEQSTASCKNTGASSAIPAAARASLEFLGLIPFSTSCRVTLLHRFSLQTWWWISPSTRKDHFKNHHWPGFGLVFLLSVVARWGLNSQQ